MPDTTIREETEYLTVQECTQICRFKAPETIRRTVLRGELPGVRMGNRVLIPAKAFWDWFHHRDIKPKEIKEVELPDNTIFVRVQATAKRPAHFKVKPKREHAA